MSAPRFTRGRYWAAVSVAALAFAGILRADDPEPKTIDEVRAAIGDVLRETHTPGMGLALVTRGETLVADGIGMADPRAGRLAQDDTVFRLGSVSKTVTALAILKLAEEGRLSLNDPVRKYAPDVEFYNPWEATDPIRIAHLLEHTTGWDDIHFGEYIVDDTKGLTIAQSLALHPDSRTSRWRPGTRMAYNNSGPVVAARVVEEITGERFEDYVAHAIFKPLHMESATYFPSPKLTGLFAPDGRRVPYWRITFRPSAALNASPADMANFVRFFLNRGRVDGVAVFQPQSIERMERAETTYGAKAGLQFGYGLANDADFDESGFVWRVHNGVIFGGRADIGYLPGAGVGYAFMINASNGEAEDRIQGIVRKFLTRGLKLPAVPKPDADGAQRVSRYTGWYEPVSPRSQLLYWFNRIAALKFVTVKAGRLEVSEVGAGTDSYVSAGGLFWRNADRSLPELAIVPNTPDGTFLQAGWDSYRRIPEIEGWFELAAMVGVAALMASSLLFALYWIPALVRVRPPGLAIRALPLLATVSLIAAGLVFSRVGDEASTFARLGAATPWSVCIFALTGLFPLFTAAAGIALWRARHAHVRPPVYVHAALVTAACATAAAYMGFWGALFFRTWA